MKNVVLIVIDSMNYSHMKSNRYLTPFINSLLENNLHYENMYSQAPFTEAASMNIYCGQNVLDRGGYIKRYKDAEKTLFESFKEKGFETYYNYFQPQCYPSSLRRGIDNIYYDVGYDVGPLWSYRFYLYADLYSNKKITEEDYKLLEEILEDNFKEWISFVKDVLNKEKDVEIIIDNSLNYDAENVLKQVEEQYHSYLKDKRSYIISIFEQKTSHPFFKISQYAQDNKIKNKEFIKLFQEKYRGFFERIGKTNKRLNKKNCKHKFAGVRKKLGYFITHPSKSSLKDFAKAILIWKEIYKDSDLFDRIADNYETFKNAPSFKKHIDHYINWERSRTSNSPSFSCIHVDDIHNPEMFFTYDTEDMSLIDEEMNDAEDVLNNLPEKYYGNITHDLSLRYIDSKLKYFFNRLKEIDRFDDTIVLICADHGFSFSGNPIRDSQITNLYLENYNIPCIVFGSDYNKEVNTLYSSKDIPFILHSLVDGKVPLSFNDGLDLFSGRKSVSIEYCGGGCPDIQRRDLKMAAFGKKWFVGSLCKLYNPIKLTEIYNLQDDPIQLKNLVNDKELLANKEIEELINKIEDRRSAIKDYQK